MTNENKVLDLEVLEKASEELAVRGDVAVQLRAQLAEVKERIPMHVSDAERMVVQSIHDAEYADEKLAAIMADEKAIADKSGVLAGLIESANRFHKTLTGWRATFTDPLAEAKRKIKSKRDAYTLLEAEKAAKEQARLQAIADEKARKERAEQERLAAAQRAKEEQARREAEAARRQAEQSNEAERKALLAEAARKEREAAAAAAKAEEREERAAVVIAPNITVSAPAARKGARSVWKVLTVDMNAMGIPVAVQGFVEIKTTNLERTKAANSMFELPGVVFHQVTQ